MPTPRIKATFTPPTCTVKFKRAGEPAGEIQVTPPPVTVERDAPGWPTEAWTATAHWGEGSAACAISGSGGGGGGGSGSGSGSGG